MDVWDVIPLVVRSVQSGQVRPTVYAKAGSLLTFPLFNFIGDSRAKVYQLFAEGRQAGLKYPALELQETYFVTEVWVTQGQRNPNPGQRPPANIPQKECVMFVTAWNTAPFRTLVKMYDIKRDKKKKAIELVFLSDSVDAQGLMGVAFLAGWRSREMSDQEVRELQQQGMRAFLREEENNGC